MKKISYFGKECTVDDDIKWVATSWYGTVLGFIYEPIQTDNGWAGGVPRRLDKLQFGSIDWENSLRKVEDVIVKENKLKIGDKVMVNDNINRFKKGQIVELYQLEGDGCHLFKGDNDLFTRMCGIHDGAFLSTDEYTVIGDTKPHPHADLMLKYAMISQYDDKPWEYFECDLGKGMWCDMVNAGFHTAFNYRLKPQEPKIQVGQIWVSVEGVEVMVDTPSHEKTIYFSFDVCGYNYKNCVPIADFLQNFKRKE